MAFSRFPILLLCLALCAAAPDDSMAAEADELIAQADAAWARRAEGHSAEGHGARERSPALGAESPIAKAIVLYESALSASPTSEEARWKLMRALFFQGEYVTSDRAVQLEIFDRGRRLGEEGIDRIAAAIGGRDRLLESPATELRAAVDDPTEAAEVLFWTAVHTGVWGRTRGKLAAAREGVASKIRDYAGASIVFDPGIENGGGHRVLGRLHTEAPKIPFITGWIDRDLAIEQLEACIAVAPRDLTTRLYLGEALVEFAPKRKQEGLRILRELIEATPEPAWLVEELKAISDAKALLARYES